jgi:hypothetical protein
MALSSVMILELIMLVSDLMVIAPAQYAKLKKAVSDGTLTEEQVDTLIAASEKTTDELIAAVDDL